MHRVYLDHNATTPTHPAVLETMARIARDFPANPASQHADGRRARRVIEEAREAICSLLGAKTTGVDADRLIFTSGGTEANNLALFGVATARPGRVLVSAVEHPSVQSAADELARRGHMVERIPATAAGVVDEAAFTRLLDAPPLTSAKPLHSDGTRSVPTANIALVSVMLGNNETGVLQPVKNLTAATRTRGIVFHTDAVQVVGKSPVSFRDLGVDLLSFTAHKFHGPIGIGGLLTRGDVKLEPLLFGGFQQAGLRPGTESAPLVAGLHKALEVWHKEAHERSRRMTSLREELEQQLTARVPDCIIVGCEVARLPHTTNVAFPGVDRQALVMALDLAGVSCSTGSACASGSSEPSPVLLAMGLPRAVVEGSIRLSLGATTTAAEINDAVERICRCVNQLRRA